MRTPVAVLRGGIEQQFYDVTRVGPQAHRLKTPSFSETGST